MWMIEEAERSDTHGGRRVRLVVERRLEAVRRGPNGPTGGELCAGTG